MKKQFVILAAAAAALLLLAGCDKQQLKGADEANGAVSVPVWFEPFGGASTKVDVDGTTGIGTWTVGDQIAIFVKGPGANFYQIKNVENIEAAPDNNTGHVMVSLAEGQDRADYAVYPASAAVDGHVLGGDLLINYPAEYDYSNLSLAQMETFSPVPMVAINTSVASQDPALNFYHVGGLLRISVPGVPQTAYALRITFPEDLKFSGTFKVTNGGTTSATLTPQGSDHGNVITVKLPVLPSPTQTVVLNIPMPSGDYTTADRNYKVDVRTQRIAFMRSDGIVNFASVSRAEGKKQTLPTVYTLGTMRELYITREYLYRDNPENYKTVDPTKMSLSSNDLLQVIANWNRTWGYRIYFNWNELGKIMTGDANFDGSSSFEEATLVIDGVTYRLPTQQEVYEIVYGPRPGAFVNEVANVRWCFVNVNLTGTEYYSTARSHKIDGILLFPDGGVFNCSSISTTNAAGANSITYADFRYLTDGPYACVFIPNYGHTRNGTFNTDNYSMWLYSGQFSATSATETTAASIGIYNSGQVNNTSTKTNGFPQHLVRVEN